MESHAFAFSAAAGLRVPLFDAQHPRPSIWIKPKLLKVSVPQQEGIDWCWAAVARGLEYAYEGSAECQCEIASRVLGTECCPPGDDDCCDTPQDLPCALGRHADGGPSGIKAMKSAQFVKDQIDKGYPIAVRIEWSESGLGHFVVISGYFELFGFFYVYVCDPEGGLRSIWRLSRFITAYDNHGVWDLTFRTKGASPVAFEHV